MVTGSAVSYGSGFFESAFTRFLRAGWWLLGILPALSLASLALAETQGSPLPGGEIVVSATGRAPIVGANTQRARSKALQQAYELAVAQGVGAAVRTSIALQNNRSVSSIRYTRIDGYVRRYDVLVDAPTDDRNYEVTINAWVTRGLLTEADEPAMKLYVEAVLGSPRVRVIIAGPDTSRLQAAATAFDEVLLGAGCRIVQTDLRRRLPEPPGINDDTGADLVLLVDLVVNETQNSSQDPHLSDLLECEAVASCSIWLQDYKQLLETKSLRTLARSTRREQAAQRCLRDLGEQFRDQLVRPLPTVMHDASATMMLELSNCTRSEADSVVHVLADADVSKDGKVLSWKNHAAVLALAVRPILVNDFDVVLTLQAIFADRLRVLQTRPAMVRAKLLAGP